MRIVIPVDFLYYGFMARRIPKGRKTYSIAYLLDKQPKGIRKDPRYGRLMDTLGTSDRLLALRFNRRCYILLHKAIVPPENLEHFYRTYRLPRHPFFPLFLAVKRAYLDERTRLKEEREKNILALLEELPEPVKDYLWAFARWESGLRGGKRAVLFQKMIYPSSLKRARLYRSWHTAEWSARFEAYRREVIRDRGIDAAGSGQELADRFVLGLPPLPESLSRGELKRRFRQLSLESHPDRGGTEEAFRGVREAYDRLMLLCDGKD